MLGSDPQVNRPLTTAFAYLLLPQVIFYGLSSVFMAILNTRNVFGAAGVGAGGQQRRGHRDARVYLLVPGELSVEPGADGQRQTARARHRHHSGGGGPERRCC